MSQGADPQPHGNPNAGGSNFNGNNAESRNRANPYVKDFERLRNMGAEFFKGAIDPKDALDWIKEMERIFNLLECPDEARVEYMYYLLRSDAYDWWLTVPGAQDRTIRYTWAEFLEKFRKQYVPDLYVDRKKKEFLDLKQQRGQTVKEYDATFHRLMTFAMELVPTERARCNRYEQGLNPQIKMIVAKSETTDLATLREAAMRAEDLVNELGAQMAEGRKRTWKNVGSSSAGNSFGGRPNQIPKISRPVASYPGQERRSAGPAHICPHCGNQHVGVCRRVTGGCFRCGDTSHFLRDCPHMSESRPAGSQTTIQGSRRTGGSVRGSGRGGNNRGKSQGGQSSR
ncbi:unnamed protein product, partial [Linum tenue]